MKHGARTKKDQTTMTISESVLRSRSASGDRSLSIVISWLYSLRSALRRLRNASLTINRNMVCLLMVVGLGMISTVVPARAVMVGLSTEELTKNADLVVKGKVESVKSVWDEDGKRIVTRVTIAGPSVIRGASDRGRIIIEYPGGEVGGIGMKVSDVDPLQEGEEVILFLKAGRTVKDGRIYHLVGKAQGKYTVGDDGIARKKGFSLAAGAEKVDNNIPVDRLIEKIERVQ
ncbi:MAG: hypothetical protein P8013_11965 [Candidatus Sulfobium sp.]|jgi:hypothetical protein